MKKLWGGITTHHWCVLNKEDLLHLMDIFESSLFDDYLFLPILLTGFYGLMCIGELTQMDAKEKQSYLKTTLHHSLRFTAHSFSFHLPYHKGDLLFDGNMIMIEAHHGSLICAHSQMTVYTTLHDAHFGVYSELWLTSDGNVPTYSWYISHLQKSLDNKVRGNSLHSGGATALALAGVNDDSIQVMGHWASDTFRIYIRKHPVILHALIHNKPAFNHTPN